MAGNKMSGILIGVIVTIVSTLFITSTTCTGCEAENASAMTKIVLGLIPVGSAVGTLIYAFKG